MSRFQPKIVRYESLPSTNTEAMRFASQGAAEGLSVIAEEQTAGRGRLRRTWFSPRGAGLYLSIVLWPLIPPEHWPLITFAAALAVNDSLGEVCGIQSDIKWPNDILSGERKLCGILSETVEAELGRAVIVGIGINLTSEAFPEELRSSAISIEEVTGVRPDREAVLQSVLGAFGQWYEELQQPEGTGLIVAEWIARSSYAAGKTVKVVNGDEVLVGTTCGLERDGALRLQTATGEIKAIRAGDVVSLRTSGESRTL
jgi:BirA family biotin operon repressor/biotin-[acetyl-CoA-carboxylase] ligase